MCKSAKIRLSSQTDRASRRQVREAARTPMLPLKDLRASAAWERLYIQQLQRGFFTSQSFMREWQWESHCWKKLILSLEFAKRHVGDSLVKWNNVLWSGETKIELFGHQTRRNVFSGHGTLHITTNTPSPLRSVVAASCCHTSQQQALEAAKAIQKWFDDNKVDVLEAKAQNSIQWRVCGRTWKGLFIPDPHASWQSLNSSARKNGVKLQCPDVEA